MNVNAKQSQGNPSKRVYVNYGRGQLYLSTPKMKMPFGLSEYDPAKFGSTGEVKLHFEPTFEGNDEFKKCMVDFENLIWDSVVANQEKWLGKRGKNAIPTENNEGMKDSFLTPMVRENIAKDGTEYPDTIRFKVVKDYNAAAAGESDKYNIYAVDHKNREIDFRDVPKMCEARFVIKFTGLVIINGKVHPSWMCCQIKVYGESQPKLPKLAFVDDSDEEVAESSDDPSNEDDTSLVDAVVPTESSEAPSRDMAQMQSALDSLEKKEESDDDDDDSDDETDDDTDDDSSDDKPEAAVVEAPKKRGRPATTTKK